MSTKITSCNATDCIHNTDEACALPEITLNDCYECDQYLAED